MANRLKFLLPSLIGALILLFPLPSEQGFKIPMGFMADFVEEQLGAILPGIVIAVCIFSAVATLVVAARPRGEPDSATELLLRPGWGWTVLRVLGAITAVLLLFELGPEWIWGESTGYIVLHDLFVPALVIIAIACIILPLVTEFGLMDFVGVLVEKPFKALFRVPGRSAIDATASWLGGSSVGIIVTADQYEKGYYSAREAAVIATNFSIVSIAFCYVIVEVVGLEAYFLPFYAALTVTGMVCAMIMARIPPLSWKPDTYLVEGAALDRDGPREVSLAIAYDAALTKAANVAPAKKMLRAIWINILDIWLGLIPAGIFIATVSLIIAEFTPFFDVISLPFVPLLDVFGVASSAEAAPAMIIGFADMFLPVLAVADVPSLETRFIVAVVSVGQLIFMSEVGILMLKSILPLDLKDLVIIFLLRTIILLPLAVLAAAIVF